MRRDHDKAIRRILGITDRSCELPPAIVAVVERAERFRRLALGRECLLWEDIVWALALMDAESKWAKWQKVLEERAEEARQEAEKLAEAEPVAAEAG